MLWFCFQTLKTTSIICREIRTKYSAKAQEKNQWRFMYDTSCSLQKKHSQKWSERLTFLWGHVMMSCDIAEFALCVDFLSGMASHDVLNWYRDTGHELEIFWFYRSPFLYILWCCSRKKRMDVWNVKLYIWQYRVAESRKQLLCIVLITVCKIFCLWVIFVNFL